MRRPLWYDYDGALQMVVLPKVDPDMAHLKFLRWMMESHRLHGDGWIFDSPSGEYATSSTPETA